MLLLLFPLFLIQILLWVFYFRGDLVEEKNTSGRELPDISIIVCAKNEIENLQAHLLLWLAQERVIFELIIVDDGSEDGSGQWLAEQSEKYPSLRVLHVEKPIGYQGKRYALWKGIEAARHPFVLLTDADCAPSSSLWAAGMTRKLVPGIDLVLGAAPLLPEKGFVNAFARYEALYTLMLYASSAANGQPYMGVGRNILYRKSALDLSVLKQAGKLSGDDDLMVNRIAHSENMAVHIHRDALCFSQSPDSWREFFGQKRRHVSTGSSYKMKHILLLSSINGSRGLFHLLALGLIGLHPIPVLAMLLSRWLLMAQKMGGIFRIGRSVDLWWKLPLLDFGLSFYQFLLAPFVFLSTGRWK